MVAARGWNLEVDIRREVGTYFARDVRARVTTTRTLPSTVSHTTVALIRSLLGNGGVLYYNGKASTTGTRRFTTDVVGHFRARQPDLPTVTLGASGIILATVTGSHLRSRICTGRIQTLNRTKSMLLTVSAHNGDHSVMGTMRTTIAHSVAVITLANCSNNRLTNLLKPRSIRVHVPSRHDTHVRRVRVLAMGYLYSLVSGALFPRRSSWKRCVGTLSPVTILVSTLLLRNYITTTMINATTINAGTTASPHDINARISSNALRIHIGDTLSGSRRVGGRAHVGIATCRNGILLIKRSPGTRLSTHTGRVTVNMSNTGRICGRVHRNRPVNLNRTSGSA